MPIAKENLKCCTFKNMVNEKCHNTQHTFGKKLDADTLKPSHEVWNMKLRYACKMINDNANLKALCFVRTCLQKK